MWSTNVMIEGMASVITFFGSKLTHNEAQVNTFQDRTKSTSFLLLISENIQIVPLLIWLTPLQTNNTLKLQLLRERKFSFFSPES